MKKKTIISVTATNSYFLLGVRFINRFTHLYIGDWDIEFHFYSEKDPSEYLDQSKYKTVFHYTESKDWHEADISRIYSVLELKNLEFDNFYWFDADTNINMKFDNDTLEGKLVSARHISQWFEENEDSGAYFKVREESFWSIVCIFGGSKEEVIKCCEATLPWIQKDKEINYVPKFITEKYLNKYFDQNPLDKVIDYSYNPFHFTDKGTRREQLVGLGGYKPFQQLTEEELAEIHFLIKQNKEKLWDIVEFKFELSDMSRIKTFK